jgi:hypothetical protein
VVCCGTRCRAIFTNVEFKNCSLIAVHGAIAVLDNCTFTWEGQASSTGIAIFARGSNTTVQVRGGILNGGKQGAAVTEGAGFTADLWVMRKVVSSNSPGATLLLRTCSFDNIDTRIRSCHGLLVEVQSLVEVVERTFSVSAAACRAKACLQRSKVSEASKHGVAKLGGSGAGEELQGAMECIVSEMSATSVERSGEGRSGEADSAEEGSAEERSEAEHSGEENSGG